MNTHTFVGRESFQFKSFRELLVELHRRYFVAYVRIKNNDVYLADERVGTVDAVPPDYKDSHEPI